MAESSTPTTRRLVTEIRMSVYEKLQGYRERHEISNNTTTVGAMIKLAGFVDKIIRDGGALVTKMASRPDFLLVE